MAAFASMEVASSAVVVLVLAAAVVVVEPPRSLFQILLLLLLLLASDSADAQCRRGAVCANERLAVLVPVVLVLVPVPVPVVVLVLVPVLPIVLLVLALNLALAAACDSQSATVSMRYVHVRRIVSLGAVLERVPILPYTIGLLGWRGAFYRLARSFWEGCLIALKRKASARINRRINQSTWNNDMGLSFVCP